MRKRLMAPGLTLALSIAGPVWAIQPTVANVIDVAPEAKGDTAVTGRVSSVGAGTARGRVAPSRRLLGIWLLTMSGMVIVLRMRRRHTFLTSSPRGRKPELT